MVKRPTPSVNIYPGGCEISSSRYKWIDSLQRSSYWEVIVCKVCWKTSYPKSYEVPYNLCPGCGLPCKSLREMCRIRTDQWNTPIDPFVSGDRQFGGLLSFMCCETRKRKRGWWDPAAPHAINWPAPGSLLHKMPLDGITTVQRGNQLHRYLESNLRVDQQRSPCTFSLAWSSRAYWRIL